MSGYRGGSSQSLSTRDFNERARALSERLGPVAKPVKETRPAPQRRQGFKFGERTEQPPAAVADAPEASTAESSTDR